MINKIINFVWYSSFGKEPPDYAYFTIEKFRESNSDFKIIFKKTIENIEYVDIKKQNGKISRIDYDRDKALKTYMQLIANNHGINLHLDTFPLRSLSKLDNFISCRLNNSGNLCPFTGFCGGDIIDRENIHEILYCFRSHYFRVNKEYNHVYEDFKKLQSKYFDCSISLDDILNSKVKDYLFNSYIIHFESGLNYIYGDYNKYKSKKL